MAEEMGTALDWDMSEASDDSYVLLPEGDYDFMVSSFEKERFEGSAKMAPCPKAKLGLLVITENGSHLVSDSLLLNTKMEWKIGQFFKSLGFPVNPSTGKVTIDFNAIEGKQGRLRLNHRKDPNDSSKEYNNIKEYIEPSGFVM